MKKVALVLCMVILVLLLFGCAGKNNGGNDSGLSDDDNNDLNGLIYENPPLDGGDGDTDLGNTPLSPKMTTCNFLTLNDLKNLSGHDFVSISSELTSYKLSCVYYSEDIGTFGSTVKVDLYYYASSAIAKEVFDQEAGILGREDVTDLGKEANWIGKPSYVLSVLDGRYTVFVGFGAPMGGLNDEQYLQGAKDIYKEIEPKLVQ